MTGALGSLAPSVVGTAAKSEAVGLRLFGFVLFLGFALALRRAHPGHGYFLAGCGGILLLLSGACANCAGLHHRSLWYLLTVLMLALGASPLWLSRRRFAFAGAMMFGSAPPPLTLSADAESARIGIGTRFSGARLSRGLWLLFRAKRLASFRLENQYPQLAPGCDEAQAREPAGRLQAAMLALVGLPAGPSVTVGVGVAALRGGAPRTRLRRCSIRCCIGPTSTCSKPSADAPQAFNGLPAAGRAPGATCRRATACLIARDSHTPGRCRK